MHIVYTNCAFDDLKVCLPFSRLLQHALDWPKCGKIIGQQADDDPHILQHLA